MLNCPNGTCNSSLILQAALLKREAQNLPTYPPDRQDAVDDLLTAHGELAKGVER